MTVVHPSVAGELAGAVAHRQVATHGVNLPNPRFISNREFVTGQTQGEFIKSMRWRRKQNPTLHMYTSVHSVHVEKYMYEHENT